MVVAAAATVATPAATQDPRAGVGNNPPSEEEDEARMDIPEEGAKQKLKRTAIRAVTKDAASSPPPRARAIQ